MWHHMIQPHMTSHDVTMCDITWLGSKHQLSNQPPLPHTTCRNHCATPLSFFNQWQHQTEPDPFHHSSLQKKEQWYHPCPQSAGAHTHRASQVEESYLVRGVDRQQQWFIYKYRHAQEGYDSRPCSRDATILWKRAGARLLNLSAWISARKVTSL